MKGKNHQDRRSPEAFAERQKSQQRLAQFVDFLPDPTFAIDTIGRVILWNRAMEELTNIPANDIMGKADYEYALPFYGTRKPILIDRIVHPGTFPEDEYSYAKHKGKTVIAEVFVRKTGKYFWCKAGPIYDDDGFLTGAIETVRDMTERKRIEENLKESEAKYRDIFENGSDFLYVHTLDGRFIETNLSLKYQFGYTEEDLGSLIIRDIMPEELRYRYEEYLEKILKKGRDSGVITIITKQGEHRIVEYKNSLVRDEQGNPVSIRGSARDMTEQVLADRALRKSEQQYRLLSENIRDVIWLLDKNLKYVYVSPSVERLRGFTVEEVKAQSLEEILTPGSYNRVITALAEEMDQEFEGLRHDPFWSLSIEVEILCKDGSFIWTEIIASFLRNSEGEITHIIGVTRDISKRKAAEDGLRTSEERFRSLFEDSAEASLLIEESRFVDCNRATIEMLGMDSKDRILNMRPSELSPEFQPDGLKSDERAEEMLALAREKGSHRFEWMHRKADGTDFPVEVVLTPITRAGKRLIYATWRDITEQKKAEEERHVYEARLMRSQKLEAIGTLAGGIAHDFNNILSAIIGYTELAIDDVPEKSSTHGSLQEVLRAGERAKDLVSQILTFSRQVQSERKVVNIHIIVKEALRLLRSSIPSSINLIHTIDMKSPPVLADPTQIHQVIMNLCTNAYQAMLNTCGTMRVSLTEVDVDASFAADHPNLNPGPFVKLTVEDTGCGMDHEVMNRIFEPFFTTKEKSRGTGLGLSTVHGIVAGLSGIITVTSRLGKGSTFDVYLPAYLGEGKERKSRRESIPAGNGENILLVDDETAILEFGKNMLEQMGYSVTTASSSTEALKLFSGTPRGFDLVITDQTMPTMTGVQLSTEMMAIRRDIPIILITGYSETLSPDDATRQGIRIYLEKPFTRMDIAAAIHKILPPVEAIEAKRIKAL